MRELKFRFWNTRRGEFAEYSDLFFVRGDGAICSDDAVEEHLVAEQYTGLKDKNGKEIYEGDIVEIDLWYVMNGKKHNFRHVVEWSVGESERYPCSVDSGFSLPASKSGYKVIGNIHENPELLEGE